ncbi:MAG: hypothetical protein V1774_00845 [Candidatus Eisenbacteria bacterium]
MRDSLHKDGRLEVPFTKWSGAGNTFVLVEAAALPAEVDGSAFARAICNAPDAPRADGLLLLDDGRARFWNRDGSRAAFCGNGARCVAARELARVGLPRVGIHIWDIGTEGWREGEEIALRVPPPRMLIERLAAGEFAGELGELARFIERMAWVEAGVAHLCLLVAGGTPAHLLQEERLMQIGAALRGHPRFGRDGSNVDFICEGSSERSAPPDPPVRARPAGPDAGTEHRARLETFERGLEALSPACGSGALAAGLLLLEGQGEGRVIFRVAAGHALAVEKKGPVWILRGPAVPVARGVFVWDPQGRD